MKAAVVIPVYRTQLSKTEERSLQQCLKILKNHDIFFACPQDLDPNFLKNFPVKTRKFAQHYFKDIDGYNRLMLESHFYESFLDYEYLLIHQLDAFVFKDELLFWCEKGYDYIGAPWIATRSLVSSVLKPFASKNIKKRGPIFYKTGNGGFSLRKTRRFFEISKALEKEISEQLTQNKDEIYAIEDVFWSLKVPGFFPDFTIPNYREAVKFAIDRKPEIALKINDNQLPFGCHGIDKPKVIDFWKPILEKEFYQNK